MEKLCFVYRLQEGEANSFLLIFTQPGANLLEHPCRPCVPRSRNLHVKVDRLPRDVSDKKKSSNHGRRHREKVAEGRTSQRANGRREKRMKMSRRKKCPVARLAAWLVMRQSEGDVVSSQCTRIYLEEKTYTPVDKIPLQYSEQSLNAPQELKRH